MHKLYYILLGAALTLLATSGAFAQNAKLQIIHNAPDPAADSVDIYVGGELFQPDFKFRTATGFTEVPADVVLEVGIAPGNSTGAEDIIATIQVGPLSADTAYVAVATGVLDPSQFPVNPDEVDTGFKLITFIGHEAASGNPPFDLAVVHGVPDAPAVDATAVAGVLRIPFVSNLVYGTYYKPADATGPGDAYQPSTPASFTVELSPTAAPETVVAAFDVSLEALVGQAAVALASGFLAPESDDLPSFALLLVLADGTAIVQESNSAVAVEQVDFNVPDRFALGDNYPNPFNPTTTFEYAIAEMAHVRVAVYDVSGRLVDMLVDQVQAPATYRASLDASGLASGTYLYQLRAGNTVITKTMMLLK